MAPGPPVSAFFSLTRKLVGLESGARHAVWVLKVSWKRVNLEGQNHCWDPFLHQAPGWIRIGGLRELSSGLGTCRNNHFHVS